jgi:hypothetical protein
MVAAGEHSAYDGFKARKIHSAAQRSRPADKLLYFMFEFQPTNL